MLTHIFGVLVVFLVFISRSYGKQYVLYMKIMKKDSNLDAVA